MTKQEASFVDTISAFYEAHGRHTLPWRTTRNPYHILVSEIMLQQTQVERVLPKYKDFLKRFPNVQYLAEASLGEVLRTWQGLGYNRRAKMLHSAARAIVEQHNGKFPRTFNALFALPGIGNYTAGAIMAFAYNVPVPIVETNIRTVYLNHFFKDKTDVTDAEILKLVIKTLDLENPRVWYAALMDYGTHLKKTIGNPNSKSKHYTRQSTFKGSDREIRGALIRFLGKQTAMRNTLHTAMPFEPSRVDAQLERLKEEGMIVYKNRYYALPN